MIFPFLFFPFRAPVRVCVRVGKSREFLDEETIEQRTRARTPGVLHLVTTRRHC